MWPLAVAIGMASVLSYTTRLSNILVALLALALYISIGGSNTLWAIYKTFPRDIKALFRYLKLLRIIRHARKNNLSVPKIFQEVVQKNGNKVAFYFENETWTFNQVDELSNRVGNYFAEKGVKHGDAIALFMENRVEYVCIWLGLTKLGAVPALINYNLRLDSLKHCIRVASCKAIICGAELQAAIGDIRDSEGIASLPLHVSGAGEAELTVKDAVNMEDGIRSSASTVPPQIETVKFSDKMVYIYTSGTTGMPKAAVIKHSRGVLAVTAATFMMDLRANDVIYSPLPLYHLASGILGCGQAILSGITVVLKRKFSVSTYWIDCSKFGCTVSSQPGLSIRGLRHGYLWCSKNRTLYSRAPIWYFMYCVEYMAVIHAFCIIADSPNVPCGCLSCLCCEWVMKKLWCEPYEELRCWKMFFSSIYVLQTDFHIYYKHTVSCTI